MSILVVLDNEFALLRFHPGPGIVHHELKKFIYGEHFREVLTRGAELLEEHRATKWLSDDRRNGAVPSADAEWARTVWQPRVLKAGWRYWAVVAPEVVVGRMSMQLYVNQRTGDQVEGRIFSDPAQAMAWLISL